MEWVLRDYRKSLKHSNEPLIPRDNVVEFGVRTNAKELYNTLKLHGRPSELQYKVEDVVTDYWDMFCEDVFCQTIWLFEFQIETVNHPTIFCKPPKCVPDET